MRTLIKNGIIYDGSGDISREADVLIDHDRIIRIGQIKLEKHTEVIDAKGSEVIPGFIEIGSTADHYWSLFKNSLDDYIRHGVTTIIGGNESVSLAPLMCDAHLLLQKWTSLYGHNIGWKSLHDFLNIVDQQNISVNYGTLLGYTTLRHAYTSHLSQDLTERELHALGRSIQEGIQEGALGVSLNSSSIHMRRIPSHEEEYVAHVLAEASAVYAITKETDNPEHTVNAFKATLELSMRTGANIEYTHLSSVPLDETGGGLILETIEKKSSRAHIHYDCTCAHEHTIPFVNILPQWAQEKEMLFHHMHQFHHIQELIDYMELHAPRHLYIAHINDPSFHFLEGKKVETYATIRNMSYGEAIIDILRITQMRGNWGYTLKHTIPNSLLYSPYGFISSYSAGIPKRTGNDASSFLQFLKKANEDGILSRERAIQKLTASPAKKYRIKKRGMLKEGYFADIVVLKESIPHYVFVNGIKTLDQGKITKKRGGKTLRVRAKD